MVWLDTISAAQFPLPNLHGYWQKTISCGFKTLSCWLSTGAYTQGSLQFLPCGPLTIQQLASSKPTELLTSSVSDLQDPLLKGLSDWAKPTQDNLFGLTSSQLTLSRYAKSLCFCYILLVRSKL